MTWGGGGRHTRLKANGQRGWNGTTVEACVSRKRGNQMSEPIVCVAQRRVTVGEGRRRSTSGKDVVEDR